MAAEILKYQAFQMSPETGVAKALAVRGLELRFGRRMVLRDVSLDLGGC